jgi:hypothetical protein
LCPDSPVVVSPVGQVAVVAAAAAVGSLAGGLVGVFKEGISAAHDAVYTGPYAELVRLIANAVYDALAPTAAAAAAGSITSGSGGGTLWHLDYALFPLAGGIAVSLLGRLLEPGNRDFGPGLSGVIEDVNAGHPFKPRQFALKQAAAVATLGSGRTQLESAVKATRTPEIADPAAAGGVQKRFGSGLARTARTPHTMGCTVHPQSRSAKPIRTVHRHGPSFIRIFPQHSGILLTRVVPVPL